MRIFFISYFFPLPAANGAQVRLWEITRRLARRHEITLAGFAAEPVAQSVLDEARAVYRDAHVIPLPGAQRDAMSRIAGWLSSLPAYIHNLNSPEMAACVAAAGECDLAVAWDLTPARYALPIAGVPRMLAEIEGSFGWPKADAGFRERLQCGKHRRFVRALAADFAAFGTVSPIETEATRRMLAGTPARVHTFPNGVDLESVPYSPPAGGEQLIYYGSLSYDANREAVDYFCAEILPLILRQRPGARLIVTGKHDDAWTPPSARHEAVRFTGFLPDPRPSMQQSAVCIVPLRSGGGTRIKVLEAMALGTPVVATSIALEGLDLTNEREVLIADDPQAFANAVVRLLDDRALANTLAGAARARVERDFNWDETARLMEEVMLELVQSHNPASRKPELTGAAR